MKKVAVLNAQDKYVENIKPADIRSGKKVAVIGAGAAGLGTAMYLRRNGVDVTVMDRREKPYGIVQYVIPEFRISSEMIQKDFEMVKNQGVNFKFGVDENFNLEELKKEYDYVVLAIGAWKPGTLNLKEGNDKAVNAIKFLENFKTNNGNVSLGKHVCVIGGGDVAMDAARAAKRAPGVASVSIVYRRTKQFMPADREEIELALEDGVLVRELLSPVAIKDGKLHCDVMELGQRDASGRRSPVATGTTVELDADTVIFAVGEQVDSEILGKNGIDLDAKGLPKVNGACETNIANVYVAGDMKKGPATIVKAMADGKAVTKDILAKEGLTADFDRVTIDLNEEMIYNRKGVLKDPVKGELETGRCLACNYVCELCVDVCPNRANIMVKVDGDFASTHQIVHLDGMCNECGNCGIFCPHSGNPYKDKVTAFWSFEDFEDSTNKGFLIVDSEKGLCKVRKEDGTIVAYTIGEENKVSKEMEAIIKTCLNDYSYMVCK